MPTEAVTVTIPAQLARELDSADQAFLVEVLQSGLRKLRIERAPERYAKKGHLPGCSRASGRGLPL